MKRTLLITALVFALPGCSWLFGEDGLFPDNSNNYKRAPELVVIAIPPGLSSEAIVPVYPIPRISNILGVDGNLETPRPAPLTSAVDQDAVRIQRLGESSWALVAVPPGQLWPQVRAFMTSAGIGVATMDAQSGLIDSQYVQLVDRDLQTRFRFRVETGIQRNTAELHILQQNQQAADIPWPAVSDDAELERNMLRNISQFLANSADSAPVSMMADRAMGDSGRISIEDNEDYTRLRLALPFDRAWASTSKGIEASGFKIDDRNRSEGIYYLTFVGSQNETDEGWLDWLWGSEEAHPLAERKYQLKLAEASEALVYITLTGEGGAQVERKDQQALLTILKGNID